MLKQNEYHSQEQTIDHLYDVVF